MKTHIWGFKPTVRYPTYSLAIIAVREFEIRVCQSNDSNEKRNVEIDQPSSVIHGIDVIQLVPSGNMTGVELETFTEA